MMRIFISTRESLCAGSGRRRFERQPLDPYDEPARRDEFNTSVAFRDNQRQAAGCTRGR